METSLKLNGKTWKESMSSQEDSHAKTSRLPVKALGSSRGKEARSGNTSLQLLGHYDQVTSSLKTFQRSLIEDSMLSLQILPKRGMMQNGLIYGLPTLARLIKERESSLLENEVLGTMTSTARIRSPKWHVGRKLQPQELVLLPTLLASEVEKNPIPFSFRKGQVRKVMLPTPRASDTIIMDMHPMAGIIHSTLPTVTVNGNNNQKGMSKMSGDGITTKLLIPTITRADGTRGNTHYMGENPTIRGALLPTLRANKIGGNQLLNMADTMRVSLPTIGANEFRGSGRKRYKGSRDFHCAKMSEGLRTSSTDPVFLNPCFAEKIMNFPLHWTEISLSNLNTLMGYGKNSKRRAKEEMFILQEAVSEKEVQRKIRGYEYLQGKEFLRYDMFGKETQKDIPFQRSIPEKSKTIEETKLRDLQYDKKSTYSSQERELVGQSERESSDTLRKLPFEISLEEWKKSMEKTICLHCMREYCEKAGYVPKALSEIKEIWESFNDEEKNWLKIHIGARREAIRKENYKYRERIKALGNSVVPQVAQFVGEIILDIEKEVKKV